MSKGKPRARGSSKAVKYKCWYLGLGVRCEAFVHGWRLDARLSVFIFGVRCEMCEAFVQGWRLDARLFVFGVRCECYMNVQCWRLDTRFWLKLKRNVFLLKGYWLETFYWFIISYGWKCIYIWYNNKTIN